MLGERTLQVNDQDQIVQSENYCYSFIRVASIDKEKKLRILIDPIKENGFTLKKARSRRYPAKNILDADYADDRALLANTTTQTKSLLHSLMQAAGGIGLHVCTNRTEHMF